MQFNALKHHDIYGEPHSLSYKIRYAIEPNNHQLLTIWLDAARLHDNCWSSHQFQFQTLLDVVADELLPSHWREACLNLLYKPLHQLSRLVKNNKDQHHLDRLYEEMLSTTHYASASIYYSERLPKQNSELSLIAFPLNSQTPARG